MTVKDKQKEIDINMTNTSSSEPGERPNTSYEKVKVEKGQRDHLETKITKNMLIVVICFFVCIVPIMLIYCTRITLSPTVELYLYVSFSIHCCLNPLIYAWKHPIFRQVFRCLLSRDLRAIDQPSRWLRERITPR